MSELFVVATPIGNLADISRRAREVLASVDLIAAEDTRHSKALLTEIGVRTPLVSYHNFNENQRADDLMAKLLDGQAVALISDAGTPLISDPGYSLVNRAREAGVKVVPIPGPCAMVAALSVAGLPSDRFYFEGFLPAKSGTRKNRIMGLKAFPHTLIFYEAPHRILSSLSDLKECLGPERKAVIARELTKQFETIRSGTLAELAEWVKADSNQQRGEIVLIIEGSDGDVSLSENQPAEDLLIELLAEVSLKKAVEIVLKVFGGKKNEVYQRALEITDQK